MISFLRYWLPLLLWMLVIFGASADPQSNAHTSRFLVPFLRWFNPNVSQETIDAARWFDRADDFVPALLAAAACLAGNNFRRVC
jgi:hypothetical protein